MSLLPPRPSRTRYVGRRTLIGRTYWRRDAEASACYENTPQGIIIAAASDPLWNNGAIRGKFFNVTCTGPTNPVPHPCTGKSIVVKIVDHCPGCGGTLDLPKEAFSTIANHVAGVIKFDYVQ
ncbi:PREDICTED: putative EG45-like domain containing protein 1 [Nicotiana attenuata]|uniref:putative EG45-like domain containing protein 1 n=1 Tax=Nicotiana attenuata TaxID=49451 RepID=UPI000904B467|nr:PREDICTED: putative EG45-like domain containing protein 1 [Nicotiana attenuata]